MRIQYQLFLVFCAYSLALVTGLIALMQWQIDNGMVDYVNTREVAILEPVIEKLAEKYQRHDGWSEIRNNNAWFDQVIAEQIRGSDFAPDRPSPQAEAQASALNPQPHEHPKRKPRARYAVLNAVEQQVVGTYNTELSYSKTPIVVDEEIVGYLAVSRRARLTENYQLDFLQKRQADLWWLGGVAMLIVAMITLPLSKHLVEPVQHIAQGMHKLTQGNFEHRINLRRNDEIGELAKDYNKLAFVLAENERARKQWLVSISHELRTPVAILRAEVDAILDGVRPLTYRSIASAHEEVNHLHRLIDDLHQLTSTDMGGLKFEMEPVDLVELLQSESKIWHSYLSENNLRLHLNLPKKSCWVYADKTRLYQLLENIIANVIHYAKAKVVFIQMETLGEGAETELQLTIADDGIGVAEEHLLHLFEPLYRVDSSRNRATGGCGLGLSICTQIVSAHQGRIHAEPAQQGGLAIIINLPLHAA